MVVQMMPVQDDLLLTFKEAMNYLRVSRSTLYRLMWSGQLTGHKVGSTWRFYREDLRACVGREIPASVLSAVAVMD
jgi:excisionase family DNA binding protein